MLSSVLASFPFCFLLLSSISAQVDSLHKNVYTLWKFDNILVQRRRQPNPVFDIHFYLHRSIPSRCDGSKHGKYWQQSCFPAISTTKVSCAHDVFSPQPDRKWKECANYPNAPEGEHKIPREFRQWLKWRYFNLEEIPRSDNPDVFDFGSVDIEVVQGIPQ
jgi:hypothetical protein